MHKIFKLALFFTVIICNSATAQVETKTDAANKRFAIVTGFNYYPPFGEYDEDRNSFTTLFDKFINDFADKNRFYISYEFKKPQYTELVREVRRGNADMILGIYNDTEKYTGLDYIYPAVISNPVTVIMLPNRIDEVKSVEDLKKLKGAVNTLDQFSDYVNREIAKFNVVRVDNSYDLFEKLFKGEIDYVFSGHYFGIVETAKLGLRSKVAFSKQVIWDIPMFFGVSKVSDKRNFIVGSLRKYIEERNAREILKKAIERSITEYETKYLGVVPPSYSLSTPDSVEEDSSANEAATEEKSAE